MIKVPCPNHTCEGYLTYDVEVGVEGDPRIPYGTRKLYYPNPVDEQHTTPHPDLTTQQYWLAEDAAIQVYQQQETQPNYE